MAAKKSNTKNKNKKKNGFKKFLTFIVILIIFAGIGYAGYNYVIEKNNYVKYVDEVSALEEAIKFDDSITSDITLPTTYNDLKITWESSNDSIIAISGKVNQPSFDEGDQEITLTGHVTYESVSPLYNLLKDFAKIYELDITKVICVKSKEMTSLEKMESVLNNLELPLETFQSIGFVSTTCYEGITLSFNSSNVSVLDNNGKVTTPATDTVVKVTVKATNGSEEKIKEFSIKVLKEDFLFNKIDINFDSVDTTNKYADINLGEVNVHNGMVVETVGEFEIDPSEANERPNEIKLRTSRKNDNDDPSFIETKMMINPSFFSFDYKFDDASHTQAKSFFNVYIKTNSEYEFKEKVVIEILEEFTSYNLDLSTYSQAQVKIEFDHEWKADSFVRIDNLKEVNKISKADLEGSVILPASTNKYIVLPFTTKYGGSVTWTSLDTTKISNNGEVLEGASGKVTMKAVITYGDINFEETHEVSIKAKGQSKDPVEIYFIDLGTYGLSDCGECTYIKFNDIDIIVDGGDHFDSTTRSICEVFESHTSDKVIDYMIVTHPDSDHIGGLPVLFENYQVNNVYKFAEETFTTQKFKNFKNAYDTEPDCNVYDVYQDVFVDKKTSEIITLSDDIYLKFINTGYLLDKETNGRSVVFELYAYDTKVLMTGDADNGGSHTNLEHDYMNQIDDIDILKVAHHGTEKGTTTEFLNQVKPEVAVICNGNYLGNKHGHPCKGALNRLNEYGNDIKIYSITGGGVNAEATNEYAYRGSCDLEESKIDRNGTITCLIDNNGYTFSCSLKSEIMDIRDSQYWDILFK